jgi:hypothetical protein
MFIKLVIMHKSQAVANCVWAGGTNPTLIKIFCAQKLQLIKLN